MPTADDLLFFVQHGDGKPLLLIHGLMVNGSMFKPLVAHLADTHHLVIPDLRGHGQSKHLPLPYSIAQHAKAA